MAKTAFKCSRCGRSFGMAAHLARHEYAVHGARRKKKVKKKGRRQKSSPGRTQGGVRKSVNQRGRSPGGRGRPRGLSNLSFEQLRRLIIDAKSEARRRLDELEGSIA